MPCPACSHTMQKLEPTAEAIAFWWCPRCGTLSTLRGTHFSHDVPRLVERCRQYDAQRIAQDRPGARDYPRHYPAVALWHSLGIEESIFPEGGRP